MDWRAQVEMQTVDDERERSRRVGTGTEANDVLGNALAVIHSALPYQLQSSIEQLIPPPQAPPPSSKGDSSSSTRMMRLFLSKEDVKEVILRLVCGWLYEHPSYNYTSGIHITVAVILCTLMENAEEERMEGNGNEYSVSSNWWERDSYIILRKITHQYLPASLFGVSESGGDNLEELSMLCAFIQDDLLSR